MKKRVAQRMTLAFRLLCCTAIMSAVASLAGAATYDLAACVERGLRTNQEIVSRTIAIREVEKELGKAGGLFFPTISLSQQLTTLNNANADERNNDYLDQGSKSTSLRLTQPLFTGLSGMNTLEKVKYLKQYRQAELQEAKLLLTRDIHRQFFDYLRWTEEAAATTATIGGLEKQLTVVRAFFAQGMAARQQLLQVEVRIALARQDLRQVETQVTNSRVRLNNLLVLEEDGEVEFSGQLAEFPYTPPHALAEYLVLADKRPELQLATINIELARREAKLILARSLPQVNAEANFNNHEVDYNLSSLTDESRDYWSLGITMSVNLMRGGADVAAYSQQLLTASRYEEERRKLKGKVETQVKTTFATMHEARQRIDSAFAINQLAGDALEATWAKFKTGLGTTVEILDAQEEVRRSLIGIARARTDFQSSRADLDYLAALGDGDGKNQ
jgi:outer membrane protein TolC